jgi:hypothetical protein
VARASGHFADTKRPQLLSVRAGGVRTLAVFTSDHRLASSDANNFDLVRLTLAALVIFEHAYFSSAAVDFFFVVSGFLVAGAIYRWHPLLMRAMGGPLH